MYWYLEFLTLYYELFIFIDFVVIEFDPNRSVYFSENDIVTKRGIVNPKFWKSFDQSRFSTRGKWLAVATLSSRMIAI